jgi:hypothetical protein
MRNIKLATGLSRLDQVHADGRQPSFLFVSLERGDVFCCIFWPIIYYNISKTVHDIAQNTAKHYSKFPYMFRPILAIVKGKMHTAKKVQSLYIAGHEYTSLLQRL